MTGRFLERASERASEQAIEANTQGLCTLYRLLYTTVVQPLPAAWITRSVCRGTTLADGGKASKLGGFLVFPPYSRGISVLFYGHTEYMWINYTSTGGENPVYYRFLCVYAICFSPPNLLQISECSVRTRLSVFSLLSLSPRLSELLSSDLIWGSPPRSPIEGEIAG